jgi:putative ABC transport system permease protein
MIRNYFIVALRNLSRNKSSAIINVLGLSLGITACVIIFLLVTYELSFDKFHHNYKDTYRIVSSVNNNGEIMQSSVTPYPFAQAFRNDFPDIPLVTQIAYEGEMLVRKGSEKVIVDNILFADSLFFKVFDFKVISGNPGHSLGEPAKVFITKSVAERLFPDGRFTSIKLHNILEAEVAGVIDDAPPNSHFSFSMIISMPSLSKDFIGGLPIDQWSLRRTGMTYVVLPKSRSINEIESRLTSFVQKYYSQDEASRMKLSLQPLSDIHFNRALFILALACINFIHLATAMAITKSKEVGIRKTLGARRSHIASYFLGETFILTLISLLISLCATELILRWFNAFFDKTLELDIFQNPFLILFVGILLVVLPLIAGLYPAVIISKYNPVIVLKNRASGKEGSFVRRALVVFQFAIAQILIISTLIIGAQMDYFYSKPLGFDKSAVINVKLPVNNPSVLGTLRTQLESNPNIQSVSFCSGAPTSPNNFSTHYFLTERGKEHLINGVRCKPVDVHYLATYGLKMKAGRWFTEADAKVNVFNGDLKTQPFAYIVNETCMRQLGFSDPEQILGKRITTGVMDIEGDVVGVVEDFHVNSLHSPVDPAILFNFPFLYYEVAIKLDNHNIPETLSLVEKIWQQNFPDHYFEFEFLDEFLARQYRHEERQFTLSKVFSGVAIFIACLGLYGLISFMTVQRVKEIGIRKVLGASVTSIVSLFSKEFVTLILVAFVPAAPVAWYMMENWLQEFQFRINIPVSMFALAIVSTLFIALVTVSYRAIRAAIANPVNSLRNE